jgi:drug/metabolite transporter (DMT)-like permease
VTARPAGQGARLATGVGVVAILLWAGLALLTVQARGIPSFELLCLTFAVAFLAGMSVLAARGRAALAELAQPWAPWLVAFVGIFFYHALYFYALSAAPAAQASLIAYLWPLLIVLLSAWAPGAAGGRGRALVGAMFGLAGTALILSQRARLSSTDGSAAAFGCAFVWSGYSVLNRRFASTPSSMLVGVCGAVALAGALCHLAFEPATIRPDTTQWIAVLALGIGPTGLAFLAWDHATKHGSLPLLGALSYLAPLVSTLLLLAAGAVAATFSLLLSALLIIGGAVVATGVRGR